MKPVSSSDSFTRTTYSIDIGQNIFTIVSGKCKNKGKQLAYGTE
jgi:hypothetical protein